MKRPATGYKSDLEKMEALKQPCLGCEAVSGSVLKLSMCHDCKQEGPRQALVVTATKDLMRNANATS